MGRPQRTTQTAELSDAIKSIAWQQIAETGAANLSLRAIARALSITAPAIYNYYPRRDDLITALIIDAYTSFGDWQLRARDSLPAEDLLGRWKATGQAYRHWALAYPQRYQLIFGASIPGYAPPLEQIHPAGARSMNALLSVIEALRQAGRLRAHDFPQITPGYEALLCIWRQSAGDVNSLSLGVAIYIWSCVHGLVSLEISGNLPPFGPEGDALYTYALAALTREFITETI